MGYEAACTVRVGRKSSVGKATLEGETLAFHGDFKLQIPFARMSDVTLEGGSLAIRTSDREVRLELGAEVAQKWVRLIKEPKGLFEKLEVTSEARVAVVGVSDPLFLPALRERTASVAEERVPEGAGTIFFGADTRAALQKVPLLRARMVENGTLWIVRPKASKAISEADVFRALRSAGLVDTKIVAFSRTHSAHKCVIPLELRGGAGRPRQAFVSLPPPPSPTAGDDAPPTSAPSARATSARATSAREISRSGRIAKTRKKSARH
ncbi:MAG TPA: hypothetical protein VEK07_12195 [Polyangiaceae bacterium]|nr:hypothetical protein [Polyangiaceae bacterium]